MNWKNDITRLLSTDYPLIQSPMYGVTTPEMVAAAARAGCLGSLPLGDLPAGQCGEIIQKTQKLSTRPFAVNLFLNDIPEITEALKARYARTKAFLEELAARHGLSVVLPSLEALRMVSYHEQVNTLLEERIGIVSFTFGNLDPSTIRLLKDRGTVLIGTCTSVAEAQALEASGIDIICVQGLEAGGHRGSFIPGDIPEIGGMSLLAQVSETVKVPLIYAGGVYNAKTLLAAKTLGAQGFQVGSLLLGSVESALKEFEKKRLRAVKEHEVILTRSFSGRYARGIRNAFIDAVEDTEFILPYPYQNKLTAELRRAAKAQENPDFVSIWLGQSLHGFSSRSTLDILNDLMAEVDEAETLSP